MKFARLLLMFFSILYSGCSSIRNELPVEYAQFYNNTLCDAGKIMFLQIGNLFPTDTVNVFFEGKNVLKNLTQDYPFPYICEKKYGGHNEYYYDFLIIKQDNSILITNFNDRKRKVIKRVPISGNLNIKVTCNHGFYREIEIPYEHNRFFAIYFKIYGDSIRVDTTNHIRWFM